MLVGAFASAAAAAFTGSVWLGLARRRSLATVAVSLVHGFASIDQRANQIVSGMAINMVAAGLTAFIGNALVARRAHAATAGRRPVPRDRLPCAKRSAPCRSSGRSIRS